MVSTPWNLLTSNQHTQRLSGIQGTVIYSPQDHVGSFTATRDGGNQNITPQTSTAHSTAPPGTQCTIGSVRCPLLKPTCVHVDLHVELVPQLRHMQHQDALNDHHICRVNLQTQHTGPYRSGMQHHSCAPLLLAATWASTHVQAATLPFLLAKAAARHFSAHVICS